MRASKFPQATRVIQPPPGMNEDECVPIYVRDVLAELFSGKTIPCMLVRIELDDEDRARIAAGGPVWLYVMGQMLPPFETRTDDPFERVVGR